MFLHNPSNTVLRLLYPQSSMLLGSPYATGILGQPAICIRAAAAVHNATHACMQRCKRNCHLSSELPSNYQRNKQGADHPTGNQPLSLLRDMRARSLTFKIVRIFGTPAIGLVQSLPLTMIASRL